MNNTIIQNILIACFLFIVVNANAQADLKTHLTGQWTVKGIYDTGTPSPTEYKEQIQMLHTAFLKSTFHFKQNNGFSLNIPIKEMSVKDGNWKIVSGNSVVITGKDSPGILMGINVVIQEQKTIFIIEETFLAFEMTKTEE